jgi:hypothetical protein
LTAEVFLMPDSGPMTTSLGAPRTVDVTGATRIAWRYGIALAD